MKHALLASICLAVAASLPAAAPADPPQPQTVVPKPLGAQIQSGPRAGAGLITLDVGALKLIVVQNGRFQATGAAPAAASVATGDAQGNSFNLEVEPLAVHAPPAFLRQLNKFMAVSCSLQHGGQLIGHTDYSITVPASGSLDSNFNEHVSRNSTLGGIAIDHVNCHLTVDSGGTWVLLSDYLKTPAGQAALKGFTLAPASILDNVISVS